MQPFVYVILPHLHSSSILPSGDIRIHHINLGETISPTDFTLCPTRRGLTCVRKVFFFVKIRVLSNLQADETPAYSLAEMKDVFWQ